METLRHLKKQSVKISTIWFHAYAACYLSICLSVYLSIHLSVFHSTILLPGWSVFLSVVITFFKINMSAQP